MQKHKMHDGKLFVCGWLSGRADSFCQYFITYECIYIAILFFSFYCLKKSEQKPNVQKCTFFHIEVPRENGRPRFVRLFRAVANPKDFKSWRSSDLLRVSNAHKDNQPTDRRQASNVSPTRTKKTHRK